MGYYDQMLDNIKPFENSVSVQFAGKDCKTNYFNLTAEEYKKVKNLIIKMKNQEADKHEKSRFNRVRA